jgi:hypothetical protein
MPRILRLVQHISANTQGFSSRRLFKYVPITPSRTWLFSYLIKLREIWVADSAKQGGTGRIDVLSWLSKMTLDVIGLAGAFINQMLAAHLDGYLDV